MDTVQTKILSGTEFIFTQIKRVHSTALICFVTEKKSHEYCVYLYAIHLDLTDLHKTFR